MAGRAPAPRNTVRRAYSEFLRHPNGLFRAGDARSGNNRGRSLEHRRRRVAMANVDQQFNDQVRAIKAEPAAERHYYTVLGCADGWLAYSISDEGIRAPKLDGGNGWYKIAKLQNGRFLCDVRQEWAYVFNWEFQATNNQGLTAQQAMDKEFAARGIPVKLRPQLVGDRPAAQ
ncbi:hypothetical protein AB4Y72_13120 [Arthrobacter sp. YAF34]|uniref:hypothetical protein n=1 Tax=Arthrobacter sp. YAF34 TaxID=3233083 RepID=UPI003F8E92D1